MFYFYNLLSGHFDFLSPLREVQYIYFNTTISTRSKRIAEHFPW